MHFIPKKLDDYVVKHTEDEPELLQQLTRETYQKILQPRMLSGHYQGRVLSTISKISNPKNNLEIGTYTGYSALCLAEGMQNDGELHTIDVNEELVDFQHKLLPHLSNQYQHQDQYPLLLEILLYPSIQFDLK